MLELVPGLLDGVVLADEPVGVLPEPDMALFNFTAPLASLQWVAADTPDGLAAEGLVVDGGESFRHRLRECRTPGTMLLLTVYLT